MSKSVVPLRRGISRVQNEIEQIIRLVVAEHGIPKHVADWCWNDLKARFPWDGADIVVRDVPANDVTELLAAKAQIQSAFNDLTTRCIWAMVGLELELFVERYGGW